MSVVVPVGVVDDALDQQLVALRDQRDAPPFEVVLALNSSQPGQRDALERAAGRIEGITVRIVDASTRRSASFARNVGAGASLGATLAFCDADDVAHSTWLAELTKALTTADAVGGHLNDFADPGPLPRWRPPATPEALPAFLGVPYLVSANMAMPREMFDSVGGFDESLTRCEDIAISWRLIEAGFRLGYAPGAIIDYRVRRSLRAMIRQHFYYGIGMSEVLLRIGRPTGDGRAATALWRPNNQPGGLGSPTALLRKAAIASGRLVGIVRERRRRAPT